MSPAKRDIIVRSDLHLQVRSDSSVVADFARLLRSKKACKLIINGDLFDLDQVAGERKAGEGAYRAINRVRAILNRFEDLSACLYEWIDRGGQIVWLPGNHDAELCLPEVQKLIVKRMNLDPARVRFETDAYREDDIHIEHGHQRDPDNRFIPDTKTAVAKERLSAFPLGCLTTRFLLCRIPAYTNQGDNHHTPNKVLMRVIRDYGWATPRMVGLYILAALRIAFQAIRARRQRDVEHQSTMFSPFRVLSRMYLDRVVVTALLAGFIIIGLTGILASSDLPSLTSKFALAAGLPCIAILLWPPTRKQRYRHRDRLGCRLASRDLRRKGAKIVIMGHTHYAEQHSGPHGTYLNPGAFFQASPSGRPYVTISGQVARVDRLAADR
ncbi:MAG: metallophosphoesterase [Deltaproteobacteria bacterium]|nr:metallophosphoesterase [Deltaproteobacteria bacterium]